MRPQSSQLATPLWTDPGFKNGIGVRKLISTLKKKKVKKGKRKASPKILAREEKATATTTTNQSVVKAYCSISSVNLRSITLCI